MWFSRTMFRRLVFSNLIHYLKWRQVLNEFSRSSNSIWDLPGSGTGEQIESMWFVKWKEKRPNLLFFVTNQHIYYFMLKIVTPHWKVSSIQRGLFRLLLSLFSSGESLPDYIRTLWAYLTVGRHTINLTTSQPCFFGPRPSTLNFFMMTFAYYFYLFLMCLFSFMVLLCLSQQTRVDP